MLTSQKGRFTLTKRIGLVLLLLNLPTHSARAAENYNNPTLQFARVVASANQSVAFLLLKEIYKRAGLSIKATEMPSKRSLTETSRGHKDGELLRVKSAETQYPSLLRVPTSVYQIKTQMFAVKLNSQLDQSSFWQNHKFASVRGILHSEHALQALQISNIQKLVDLKQMLNFVCSGRAEIAITSRLNGLRYMKQTPSCDLSMLEEPLYIQPLYHYLHKKHEKLIPIIDKVIQEMKLTGELETLTKRFEFELLNQPY